MASAWFIEEHSPLSIRSEEALEPLYKAVSPLGLVSRAVTLSPDPGDPKVFLSMAAPANPKAFASESRGLLDPFTCGMGFTQEQSLRSAIAEAIERYCAAYVRKEMTVRASWQEMTEPALHPEQLPLFLFEQYEEWNFPYGPFSEDSVVRWVKGWNLTRDQPMWVPAALVWDSYVPQDSGETHLCFGLMTGSACGSTPEQAIVSGLLEVVERDSFMIMWYNSLSMPRIDLETFREHCPWLDSFRALTDRSRFELHLMETTSDIGIPSVFGLLKTMDNKIAVGGAARPTLESAVQKTLLEISQSFMGNKSVLYNPEPAVLLPFQVTDFASRLFYYSQPQTHRELEFAYASAETRSYRVDEKADMNAESDKARMQRLVKRLAERDLEVIAVDITTEDVRGLGMHVMKAIVPGAAAMPRSEKERLLQAPRLYDVPVRMGYRQSPLTPADLNASPHPFP